MRGLSVLVGLVAATTAVAMQLERRSSDGCFQITRFRNSGSPHSIQATMSFDLASSSSPPLANITCYAAQAIQPSIATTQLGTKCSDPAVLFGFQYAYPTPGYLLTIVHAYNGNKTVDSGTVYVNATILTYENPFNPNGNYQYLGHEPDFDVSFNRVVVE